MSSDDDDTPSEHRPRRRRFQTQTDRDLEGAKAKMKRDAVPSGEFDVDEITGRHAGDELKSLRSTRPPEERLTRLEDKHDVVISKLSDHEGKLGRIEGKLDGLDGNVQILVDLARRDAVRDDVTFDAKVSVHRAQAEAEIEVQKEYKTGEIKKSVARHQWVTKALAVLGAVGTAVATAIAAGRC
jgi:hypothetical protein